MPLSHDQIYICVDVRGEHVEMYNRGNEQAPEVVGIVELFYAYRTVSGHLFAYPQEIQGYQCVRLSDFMNKHEMNIPSWVMTTFAKKTQQYVA